MFWLYYHGLKWWRTAKCYFIQKPSTHMKLLRHLLLIQPTGNFCLLSKLSESHCEDRASSLLCSPHTWELCSYLKQYDQMMNEGFFKKNVLYLHLSLLSIISLSLSLSCRLVCGWLFMIVYFWLSQIFLSVPKLIEKFDLRPQYTSGITLGVQLCL